MLSIREVAATRRARDAVLPACCPPCTQPRAPVLPINSHIARPGIRQLGVVTFRSGPTGSHHRALSRVRSTILIPHHVGLPLQAQAMQPAPSGGLGDPEGAPLFRFRSTSVPAIGSCPTTKNAYSRNARDARRLARIGRTQATVPVPRASRGRRAPGGGTATLTASGEREGARVEDRIRDGGKERERERVPGRALCRECSRAGNQCRFRGSGGHHAADYTDYTDYICTRRRGRSFLFREEPRSHLIPSVARHPRGRVRRARPALGVPTARRPRHHGSTCEYFERNSQSVAEHGVSNDSASDIALTSWTVLNVAPTDVARDGLWIC